MRVHNLSLRLPFSFETEKLNHDLRVCQSENWPDHFHSEVYTGSWSSIALFSPSGEQADVHTESSDVFKPTALLEQCHYFREILNSMLFTKQSVRLLRLAAGSEIKTHRDLKLHYLAGLFRLHIPLSTDDRVAFIIGGERLDMKAGECWYGDFDQPHSVLNSGTKDRIHLVIDGERNEWTDQIFAEAGYDFEAERRQAAPDTGTKQRMIQELLAMNTPVARSLAHKLMNEQ